MHHFDEILAIAAERKGGVDAVLSGIPSPKSADDLAAIPDDRWLAQMARGILQAGISWKVVDSKWPDYRLHCDRLYFATHPDVPAGIFPEECGFILSDGYGAEILREAPEHKLAPATRRALLTRFARAGADRLLRAELAGAVLPGDD